MSGFPSGGEALGSASFGLRADGLTAFQREMTAAGNAVEGFGARAADAVGEGGGRGGKFLGGLRGAVKGFRGIIGVASGAASAIMLIVTAITALIERLNAFENAQRDAMQKAEELPQDLANAVARYKGAEKEIQDLQSKLGWKRENPVLSTVGSVFGGETEASLEAQAKVFELQRKGAEQQIAFLRGKNADPFEKATSVTQRTLLNASGGSVSTFDFSPQARSQLVGALRSAVHGGGR